MTVRLTDRREFQAKVIGADLRTDVAVVKINAAGLSTVAFGDSSKVRVGDWAIAMLNRGTTPLPVNFDWTTPVIADELSKRKFEGVYTIYDLWTKTSRGDSSTAFVAEIPAHGRMVVDDDDAIPGLDPRLDDPAVALAPHAVARHAAVARDRDVVSSRFLERLLDVFGWPRAHCGQFLNGGHEMCKA